MSQKINTKTNEILSLEMEKFSDLEIVVSEGSSLTLKLVNFDFDDLLKISAKVKKNATFDVVFADFSSGNSHVISNVDLVEENATCNWHLATLSSASDNKVFDVSFKHLVGHTNAVMDNYGVARDSSHITFTGCNHILNNAKQSVTRQNAKIIVFDKEASGTASPILKIDENDVVASHGAVVGQLNEGHMFYLMSRGLSKDEARVLITMGYLQPISAKFSEVVQKRIEERIKELI